MLTAHAILTHLYLCAYLQVGMICSKYALPTFAIIYTFPHAYGRDTHHHVDTSVLVHLSAGGHDLQQ
jgi:hypothetical protein